MKQLFRSFNIETDKTLSEIWSKSETIFVVDTNVLLNLYEDSKEKREAVFQGLKNIKDKLWSPYQVMLEFHNNRLKLIQKNDENFKNIDISLVEYIKDLQENLKCGNLFSKFLEKYSKKDSKIKQQLFDYRPQDARKNHEEIFEEVCKEIEKEVKFIKKYLTTSKKSYVTSFEEDFIYDQLANLYTENNINLPFKDLEVIYKEGEERYKNKRPPGFLDNSKGDEVFWHNGLYYKNKFGDLLLFKEILNYCKDKNIKNVVFISEDIKEDWLEKNNNYKIKILWCETRVKRGSLSRKWY